MGVREKYVFASAGKITSPPPEAEQASMAFCIVWRLSDPFSADKPVITTFFAVKLKAAKAKNAVIRCNFPIIFSFVVNVNYAQVAYKNGLFRLKNRKSYVNLQIILKTY